MEDIIEYEYVSSLQEYLDENPEVIHFLTMVSFEGEDYTYFLFEKNEVRRLLLHDHPFYHYEIFDVYMTYEQVKEQIMDDLMAQHNKPEDYLWSYRFA